MQPNASMIVTIGIPLIGLSVGAALIYGTWRSGGRVSLMLLIVAGWSAIAAALSLSGIAARFDARPPPLVPFFAATLLTGLGIGFSRLGSHLSTLPLPLLVGFHAFRLPLELVMHKAASDGTMPVQMSYSGMNFDIVTGASALVLALVLAKRELPRALVLGWNTLGALLLATIVGIAVLSTPLFHAFGTRPEQLNTWVSYFPYIYIALAVMGALVGHVVIFRKMLGARQVS